LSVEFEVIPKAGVRQLGEMDMCSHYEVSRTAKMRVGHEITALPLEALLHGFLIA
jgi:hypothetical protein